MSRSFLFNCLIPLADMWRCLVPGWPEEELQTRRLAGMRSTSMSRSTIHHHVHLRLFFRFFSFTFGIWAPWEPQTNSLQARFMYQKCCFCMWWTMTTTTKPGRSVFHSMSRLLGSQVCLRTVPAWEACKWLRIWWSLKNMFMSGKTAQSSPCI